MVERYLCDCVIVATSSFKAFAASKPITNGPALWLTFLQLHRVFCAPEAAPASAAAEPEVAADAPKDLAAEVAAPVLPDFDVVRVEPDGTATVAGSAEALAKVSLRVDGTEVFSLAADGGGKFAALFTLSPSAVPRLLSVVAIGADGAERMGKETVALAPVVVPQVAQLPVALLALAPARRVVQV